jgi:hypothetical protein
MNMNIQEFIVYIQGFIPRYIAWRNENPIPQRAGRFSRSQKALEGFRANFNASIQDPENPIEEFYAFLDTNYDVYLNADPKECAAARLEMNRELEYLLILYVDDRAVIGIDATGDRTWLLRGLVAISLENSGVDWRDSTIRLTDLYIAAKRKGFNPQPDFERVAEISSYEKPRGGLAPMQEMMINIWKSVSQE